MNEPIERKQHYKEKDLVYIRKRWDDRAYTWDKEISNPESHLNRKDSYNRFFLLLDKILEKNKFISKDNYLDIGCGTGAVLNRYKSYFHSSTGVDISENMIEVAKKHMGNEVSFICSDVFKALKYIKCMNLITSRGVLLSHYGIVNAKMLLSECYNSLKENGLLFFDVLNKGSGEINISKTYYCKDEITSLLKETGFTNIKVYEEDNNYPLLYAEAYK